MHEANFLGMITTKVNCLPKELISDGAFSVDFVGDESGDFFLDSAVRTEERAATAAALCEP